MKKYLKRVTILIALLFSLSTFADSNHYLIFIDAASSGSRLHIFQYEKTSFLPIITDVFSESTKPGLSDYADNPTSAGSSLKKLLDDADQFLVSHGSSLHAVPVSLLATAGMRLLPKDKTQAIYKNIYDYIKNKYLFSIHEIKTISGKREGLYGWLDINYLLGTFQNHQATVGSIDMGGASTQIAFATDDHSIPKDEISITINGQNYTVFSKSFLGLGQDQAREAMKTYPAAFNCFPKNYIFNHVEAGNFNMLSCAAIYADIIEKNQVAQHFVTTQKQAFIAYSGIYFTYHFFDADQTPDQFSLEASIQNICNRTYEQLQKDYPQVPENYLFSYCANAIYHDKLLYDTYRIEGPQLTVANQINQNEINWTLGAALYSLNSKDA